MPAQEHHLQVSRSARYWTLGTPGPDVRETWFALHGHAQLAQYFIRGFAGIESPHRLIVAPEGLNRFYLEQTHWKGAGQARVGATWMTREDREHEIADYVGYLDTLHRAVSSGLPGAELVVLGFSQGVSTAMRWLTRGAARAGRLILWAGPVPPELDTAAVAPLRGTRLTRVLGDDDETAPPGIRAAEAAKLQSLGLEAELVTYTGGHRLDAPTLLRIAG